MVFLTKFPFSSSSCFSTDKLALTYITAQLVIATKSVTMERRAMFLLLERSMLCACSAWKFWIFIGREFVNYGYRLFGFSWLFTQFVMTKSTRSLIIRLFTTQ
jgi:hypothetical protein